MPSTFDPSEIEDAQYCIFTADDGSGEFDTLDKMLVLTNCEIGDPQARRYEVDIPGRDNPLDLTEALGGVYFGRRQVTLTFACINFTTPQHIQLASELRNLLDGKLMRCRISADPAHFWLGRCQVEVTRPTAEHSEIVVTVDADAHKYSVLSSYEPWQWDSFSFVEGVIIQIDDIVLNNETKSETLPVDPARGKPILWLNSGASGAVSARVSSDQTWHPLRSGKNVLPEVRLSDKAATVLYLRGTGNVGIEYRLGSL